MMDRLLLRKRHLYLFAISAFLISSSSPGFSETITKAQVVSYSGSPTIIANDLSSVPLKKQQTLPRNAQIQTGPNEWVEIQFSGKKGCRFVLAPNSVLDFTGAKTPTDYRAVLRQGTISCQSSPCQVTLNVETSIGHLRGRNSMFSVRVNEDTTTVFLKSGDLRLFLGGEAIPLREMTRTTISHSGSHRIASLAETQAENTPSPPSMAFQNNNLPASPISPVSATKGP